jgi:hypothetical protein
MIECKQCGHYPSSWSLGPHKGDKPERYMSEGGGSFMPCYCLCHPEDEARSRDKHFRFVEHSGTWIKIIKTEERPHGHWELYD